MNITKQQWTIIGVVVAIIAVWYFFLRKKKSESSYRVASASKAIGCPEWQTWNPITKRCENRSYSQSKVKAGVVGVAPTGTASKIYVYECKKKNADGTWTVTSGYSSNPSGNCSVGFEEKIIKTIA